MGQVLRALGAVALVVVAFPIAVLAGLFSKGRQSTPEEFAATLMKFAGGTEGERDWDVFESVPMRDARLEAIRQEVMQMDLPLRSLDRTKLSLLAEKARTLSR
jgi:hypothetical protein